MFVYMSAVPSSNRVFVMVVVAAGSNSLRSTNEGRLIPAVTLLSPRALRGWLVELDQPFRVPFEKLVGCIAQACIKFVAELGALH